MMPNHLTHLKEDDDVVKQSTSVFTENEYLIEFWNNADIDDKPNEVLRKQKTVRIMGYKVLGGSYTGNLMCTGLTFWWVH